MKKTKKLSRIIETSMGKYLYRDIRPPIPLRTSPRKENHRIKKDLKRLNGKKVLSSTLIENNVEEENEEERRKKKKKLERIKKQLSFYSNERKELKSILLKISSNDDEEQLNEDFLTDYRSSLCFVNVEKRRCLIFSPRSSRLTFEGIFSIEQLFGFPSTIFGFQIDLLTKYNIYNLSSQSLISIETNSLTSKLTLNDDQILSLFSQYEIHLNRSDIYLNFIRKTSKIHQGLSIYLVEEYRSNWIESMKEYSIKSTLNNSSNDDQDDQSTTNKTFEEYWNNFGAFQDSQIRSIFYSDEIHSIIDEILSMNEEKPLRIFVCGAKDSGKSTFLRYLINRCLNDRENPKRISFLDCDIGQSEFTPSGTLSLINQINEPLFGPSATHLKKATKSFFFGNIQVNPNQIDKYLNYVKTLLDSHQQQSNEIFFINTMGWGADNGLIIMKELIDLIRPTNVIQLRSTNPYYRHSMPDLDPQWSQSASLAKDFRQFHHFPFESIHHQYEYHLFVTPVRQHNQQGKSRFTRQMSLWSYFSQLNRNELSLKSFIDCSNRIEIFSFQQISIGILHRQIQVKYFLQVLNASIVALCRIRPDMIYRPSNDYPGLIDERASIECLGFGFIRSIDMKRGEFHLIIPDGNLSRNQINGLIKGNDDCPDEFYFMSIDRWRGAMPPYVTGMIN